jgi:glutamyl-tRNA synthetase
MPVRTRYAPSPTGVPHVGNIRTALFAWLLARHEGGQFLLRFEDTDRQRYVPESIEPICESLRWLGLNWDEGPDTGGPHAPYVQSDRRELYVEHAQRLIEGGHAYECFCSSERLDEVRKAQQKRGEPPKYDRLCRDLSDAEREAKRSEGVTPVVRFRTPLTGITRAPDYLRGEIEFDNATLDDFVLLKSDGYPTYQLAAIVDDQIMEISHVLRGDEWISSLPRNWLTYQAFGWEPPVFVHLPVIVGPDRAKLAKRHGATSALEYRDQGYLPEAMVNFLVLLGWSLDDKTVIISRDELVEHFTLDRITKNPAAFDLDKLTWMNGEYIRALPEERLVELFAERLERDMPDNVARPIDRDLVRRVVPLVRERIKTLAEVAEMVEGFFVDAMRYGAEELLGKRFRDNATGAAEALRQARERLESVAWEHELLEQAMRSLAEERELKAGDLFMLLRVAVMGKAVSPPLFESMEVLGREKSLARIDRGVEILAKNVA